MWSCGQSGWGAASGGATRGAGANEGGGAFRVSADGIFCTFSYEFRDNTTKAGTVVRDRYIDRIARLVESINNEQANPKSSRASAAKEAVDRGSTLARYAAKFDASYESFPFDWEVLFYMLNSVGVRLSCDAFLYFFSVFVNAFSSEHILRLRRNAVLLCGLSPSLIRDAYRRKQFASDPFCKLLPHSVRRKYSRLYAVHLAGLCHLLFNQLSSPDLVYARINFIFSVPAYLAYFVLRNFPEGFSLFSQRKSPVVSAVNSIAHVALCGLRFSVRRLVSVLILWGIANAGTIMRIARIRYEDTNREYYAVFSLVFVNAYIQSLDIFRMEGAFRRCNLCVTVTPGTYLCYVYAYIIASLSFCYAFVSIKVWYAPIILFVVTGIVVCFNLIFRRSAVALLFLPLLLLSHTDKLAFLGFPVMFKSLHEVCTSGIKLNVGGLLSIGHIITLCLVTFAISSVLIVTEAHFNGNLQSIELT